MEASNTLLLTPVSKLNQKEGGNFHLECLWKDLEIYFDALFSPLEVRWLRVAGLLIKLKCRNPTLLRYVDIQLACCFTNETGEPDAVFSLWCGNIASCLPKIGLEERIHIVKDNLQALIVNEEKGRLSAFDPQRTRGYFCLQDESDQSIANQGYLLYQLLYNLAKHRKRLMLHAAALGYDNKGVLICGRSGQGKSTLAVSSLLQNCQYVSDDHLMLTKNGNTTEAWPVYSIGSLYEESLMQMPELSLTNRWLKDRSKPVFDLSSYHHQFNFGLPIKALIFPLLALESRIPSCALIAAGRVLAHLIWSTITQVNDRKDPEHIRNIIDFLKNLPCYQLSLSSDIDLNAKFLKEFIINKLK